MFQEKLLNETQISYLIGLSLFSSGFGPQTPTTKVSCMFLTTFPYITYKYQGSARQLDPNL